ncbi:single-stranded DNA-binding protein [Elizabethkingia anophelis]|uniref:single-stranded DNA-binding protein n=1 Tax=Elizabethkingia anophelis TaxID=1117645 RepID=UPI001688F2C9|nr:single-stranded DNA-binding protein [Elizabethkingia anophelis]QNV11268.1 hypothetical protein EIY88_18875 [Elizabethkingia anophelis]UTG04027.1 single-stranded DNA-binding protein [Elizabethkingia anophelis]UTG07770.1 single-stranded DNA-binding protein [Elizabethkingia anophelis]UTG11512.1 single-stranded DNA-binding protein [Elizabethkingia anophelis]UTG18955.1 single-stranded DNA-binding protein [Elizabethkingia anophelis]
MFNAFISGNLTKDATSREVQTEKGTIYAIQFTVATNEKYGERERSAFFPCTYWSKSDKITEHLVKGVAVNAVAKWYSNNEHDGRYYQDFEKSKVEFQRGKSASSPEPTPPPSYQQTNQAPVRQNTAAGSNTENVFGNDDDDDLPF